MTAIAKPDIIIVDIDGTLTDCEHRLHHIRKDDQDWDAFYDACDKDPVIVSTLSALFLFDKRYHIVFVTGRPERLRQKTLAYMEKHAVPAGLLYMRPDDDQRPDFEFKRDVLLNNIGKERVLLVLEDRKSVVDMWRQEGLTCWQVADGDF